MHHFTAHRLRFVAEVQMPIELNEHQGSAIRGALFNVLRRQFCAQREYTSCQPCALHAACPVSFLLATVDDEAQRGADLPRPYTVEPPLNAACKYQPGDALEFGLTMFSRALTLFPYVVVAAQSLQQDGLGRKLEANNWRRGAFTLQAIWAENPLTGERQQIMQQSDPMVSVPDVPITHAQVLARSEQLMPASGVLTISFLTPTRLTERGALLHTPRFRPFVQRLFERLSALARAYCDSPLDLDFRGLLDLAESVELAHNGTRWVELESYSTRRHGRTPMGGLVGSVTYSGDLRPFLPWLLWGQFTHVGKDAVKGNGWYQIGESTP